MTRPSMHFVGEPCAICDAPRPPCCEAADGNVNHCPNHRRFRASELAGPLAREIARMPYKEGLRMLDALLGRTTTRADIDDLIVAAEQPGLGE